MEEVKQKLEKVNNEFLKIAPLRTLSEKSNVPAGVFVFSIVAVCVILVGFGVGFSGMLVQVLGVLYPVYKSMTALESESLDDDKQWLTYWIIFALFSAFDALLGSLLAYIPFFQLIKLLLLIWLQNPMTDGATKIYDEWLDPLGRKYEK